MTNFCQSCETLPAVRTVHVSYSGGCGPVDLCDACSARDYSPPVGCSHAPRCYSCDFNGAPTGGLTAYRPSFPESADYTPAEHPEVVSLCNPCAAYCLNLGMTLEEIPS